MLTKEQRIAEKENAEKAATDIIMNMAEALAETTAEAYAELYGVVPFAAAREIGAVRKVAERSVELYQMRLRARTEKAHT